MEDLGFRAGCSETGSLFYRDLCQNHHMKMKKWALFFRIKNDLFVASISLAAGMCATHRFLPEGCSARDEKQENDQESGRMFAQFGCTEAWEAARGCCRSFLDGSAAKMFPCAFSHAILAGFGGSFRVPVELLHGTYPPPLNPKP